MRLRLLATAVAILALAGGGGRPRADVTPAGLSLIDPSDWSTRRVSDQPGWVASGTTRSRLGVDGGLDEQTLIVFDSDGSLRFSLAREGADLAQTHDGYLYATRPRARLARPGHRRDGRRGPAGARDLPVVLRLTTRAGRQRIGHGHDRRSRGRIDLEAE